MMQSSLVPERPLIISPTLASTIGLEEAVMLHVLSELMSHRPLRFRNSLGWLELDNAALCDAFPFWAFIDIKRVQKSLQNLGLILIDPETGNQESYYYAINQFRGGNNSEVASASASAATVSATEASSEGERPQITSLPGLLTRFRNTGATAAAPGTRQSSASPSAVNQSGADQSVGNPGAGRRNGANSYMPPDWRPGEDWIRQCRQHNIPDDFIQEMVPGFVLYWRERKQTRFSWGNAFYKHVLREWRQEQTRRGAAALDMPMSAQWQPSLDALAILEKGGINRSFIEDAVPEFVLYWRERGVSHGAWNSKFVDHVRRQWARFSGGMDQGLPRKISEDWQPSAECFEILALAEIDEDFARNRVKEFILYWKDRDQAQASWNTRFLQYIKFSWARQLDGPANAGSSHAQDKSSAGADQRSTNATFQRFTDRSWAD